MIFLPIEIATKETAAASIEYRWRVEDNSGLAAISPIAFQFLPTTLWYPSPNTSFAVRGADYAPFRLTINGGTAVSSGSEKSAGGNRVFEQSPYALPFFVAGAWGPISGGAKTQGTPSLPSKVACCDPHNQAPQLLPPADY